MSRKTRLPEYCHHKAKGQAYVRLNGEFIYLGPYGSEESKAAYQRIVAEWLARGRAPMSKTRALEGPSINEILLAYWHHAESYYVLPDGTPSGELENIRNAIRPLKEMYGTTPAAFFGPVALKAVRQKMIDSGLCRNVINQRVGTIKRIFRWATSDELVPASVDHGLRSVDGLRRGRSPARETEPIKPVPDGWVDAVLPFCVPTVRAMIEVQRLTGMRSGELVFLRACDIEMTGATWQYRPAKHKTAHHGHQRIVAIGPRAQNTLRAFLTTNMAAYLFSPYKAREERFAILRAARQTKVQPSQNSRRKRNPKKLPGECYTTDSYYRAVCYGIRAAQKAGALPPGTHWYPHRLRHTFGTFIRKMHGLDAARAMMGHHSLAQAAEYAEIDASVAMQVAAQVG